MATAAAKKAALAAGAVAKNGTGADIMADAPAGFRQRSAESEAPWVAQEKGNVCYGELINRYPMNGQDPPRHYYQVELLAACKVRVGRGEEVEIEEASVGTIVNLNENYKTSCLKDIEIPEILAGASYTVWVKFEDKLKIGGGKTMWQIKVKSAQKRPPTSPVRALPSEGGAEGEVAADTTPF